MSTSASLPESTPTSDNSTPDLANSYEAFGNPDAAVVIVNAQGGPLPELETDELRSITDGIDLDQTYVVKVHQAQTLEARFGTSDIDFETAKAADTDSVRMLADVVNHFTGEGRRVFVLGVSFGAFVVQDLIASEGISADGYLIVVGRLDMPAEVWTEFSQGRTVGFVDGVDVVAVPIEEAGMGAPTAAGDRNMARLAAGLGYNRYTELLADTDLSAVRYVYGLTDEQVGRLTDAEIAFLRERGAQVTSDPGGHGTTVDNHVGSELGKLLAADVD